MIIYAGFRSVLRNARVFLRRFYHVCGQKTIRLGNSELHLHTSSSHGDSHTKKKHSSLVRSTLRKRRKLRRCAFTRNTSCYVCSLCPHRTANANAAHLPYPLLAVTETCPTAIVAKGQSRATDGAVRTMLLHCCVQTIFAHKFKSL